MKLILKRAGLQILRSYTTSRQKRTGFSKSQGRREGKEITYRSNI
jgi:hypothetical protein